MAVCNGFTICHDKLFYVKLICLVSVFFCLQFLLQIEWIAGQMEEYEILIVLIHKHLLSSGYFRAPERHRDYWGTEFFKSNLRVHLIKTREELL